MIDPDGHWPNWGKIWNGVKTVAKVGFEVVKEVSGYNDIANFIREPSWGNFLWAASNFVPFGKLAKGAKYLFKYGDDLLGGARKYGDDVVGAGRKYGDDVAGTARKYGDDVAGAARRNAADMAKTAAREAAQAAARKAAAAAAAAAARLARMKAITARAKAAISHAVKNNAMPVLQAALKPKIAMKDLVSSSANLPARVVAAVAENVQDVNKVWDTIKATIIKPGVSVIQSVGEQMVSDFANSQIPGLGDLIGMFGPNRKRGNDKAKDSGAHGRNEAGASCPIPLARNSFTGDTPVLMADGSRKLIRDLRDGDMVLATNPKTGRTEGKKVTDVRRYLTDSKVFQIDVKSDSGTGKITATDEHPFWVPELGRWLGTEDLKPGYRFTTADNRPATVTGTRSFSGLRLVYNITVDGIHTYYVGAGGAGKAAAADVLVHNDDRTGPSGCGSSGDADDGDESGDEVDPQSAPGGKRGAAVSIKQLKMALGRAGMSISGYDIVHVPGMIDNGAHGAHGNSPHDGRGKPNLGPRGRPIIEIADSGLTDMRSAVATVFHEIEHHRQFKLYGVNMGEAYPEEYGQKMADKFERRTRRPR